MWVGSKLVASTPKLRSNVRGPGPRSYITSKSWFAINYLNNVDCGVNIRGSKCAPRRLTGWHMVHPMPAKSNAGLPAVTATLAEQL